MKNSAKAGNFLMRIDSSNSDFYMGGSPIAGTDAKTINIFNINNNMGTSKNSDYSNKSKYN